MARPKQIEPEPLLLSADAAAKVLQVSRTTLYVMNVTGKLGPRPLNLTNRRCPRWSRAELQEWIAAGCPRREVWERQKTAAKTA